jgi:hypothetical protein
VSEALATVLRRLRILEGFNNLILLAINAGDAGRSRHFTAAQRREILAKLCPYAGQTITVTLQSHPREVREFAREVMRILVQAGWRVQRGRELDVDPALNGVYFGPHETPARPALSALIEAFTGAGILMRSTFQPGTFVNVTSDGLGIAIRRSPGSE